MSDPHQRLLRGRHTCMPRKYAKRDDLPNTPEAKSIVVGVRDCLRTPPILQPRDPDLTGVWEDEDDRVSVVINHAGFYVAFWISEFSSASATHFLARGTTPNFAVYEPGKFSASVGSLSADAKVEGALRLELGRAGWSSYRLIRVSDRATLSDRALAYLGAHQDAEFVRRVEHAPVSSTVLRATEEILVGRKMLDLLEEFFAAPVSWRDRAAILKAAKRIDEHVQDLGILDGSPADRGGGIRRGGPWRGAKWHTKEILQRHADAVMAVTPSRITIRSTFFRDLIGISDMETTKTVFERLVDVMVTIHDPRLAPLLPLPALVKLGIPRPDDVPKFVYEFKVHLEGIAGGGLVLGGCAFRGDLWMRQIEPFEEAKATKLHIFLAGLSGGRSVGIRIGFDVEGIGRSHTPWATEEILGPFSVYEASESIAVGTGQSFGFTEWQFRGTGGRPPLSVAFGTAETRGLEFGKSVGAATGYVTLDEPTFTEMFVPVDVEEDYVASYQADGDVHFELGSATLSERGRDIVGWLCATELAAIRDPFSKVRFIGSADRVDVRWYNLVLSDMRAMNTQQALRDAAGPGLSASTQAYGLGEELAAALGDPDRKENPEFRRVWVELNGRTVATLRGAESRGS